MIKRFIFMVCLILSCLCLMGCNTSTNETTTANDNIDNSEKNKIKERLNSSDVFDLIDITNEVKEGNLNTISYPTIQTLFSKKEVEYTQEPYEIEDFWSASHKSNFFGSCLNDVYEIQFKDIGHYVIYDDKYIYFLKDNTLYIYDYNGNSIEKKELTTYSTKANAALEEYRNIQIHDDILILTSQYRVSFYLFDGTLTLLYEDGMGYLSNYRCTNDYFYYIGVRNKIYAVEEDKIYNDGFSSRDYLIVINKINFSKLKDSDEKDFLQRSSLLTNEYRLTLIGDNYLAISSKEYKIEYNKYVSLVSVFDNSLNPVGVFKSSFSIKSYCMSTYDDNLYFSHEGEYEVFDLKERKVLSHNTLICEDSYIYDNYLYAYIFDGSYNNSKIEKYLIQNDKVQLVDSRIVPPDKYTQSEWNNGETRIVFKIALSEPYTVYGKRGESHKLYDYCISIEDNSTISSFTLSGLNKDVDYYDENISMYLLHYKVTIYEKNNIIYFGFDITDKQYMIITYDLTQMSMKYNTYVTGGTTKLINANDKLYIPATSGLIQLTD